MAETEAKLKSKSSKDPGGILSDGQVSPPLYYQIYGVLRDEILNGTRVRGSMLPGEMELGRQFSVSRITAKRVLNELAAAGLVVRERGRGTRVVYNSSPPIYSAVEGLLENIIAMGLKTSVELLDFAYLPATEPVAQALSCKPGELVQKAVRLRSLDAAPISYLTTHVPEDIGRTYGQEELATQPLLSLLERSGVVVSSASQAITATLANARLAALLQVAVGAPLLSVSRIVRDQNDRPVEFIETHNRPDRYRYQTNLQRVEDLGQKLWSPVMDAMLTPEPDSDPEL